MAATTRALFPLGWLMVAMACATAAEPDPNAGDFKSLSDRARSLIKAKTVTPDEREAIVAELAKHPSAEPGPRSTSRAALVGMCDDQIVRAQVLAAYKRESKRPGPLAAELALVLLAVERDAKAAGFRETLDRQPAGPAGAAFAGVLSAAAAPGDATAIAALRSLAQSRWFGASLACRRGLIQTLADIKDPAAVEVLVDMLQGIKGEARGDVIASLARISGEHHGNDGKAWRTWFDAHRDALTFDGAKGAGPPAAPAADASQAEYYDIPIYANRVVFVLDTSGSMMGAPLEAAKRELESAIGSLPDDTLFTVVFFNTGVGPWQRQLVPASEANKRAAATFVRQLPPEGGTATSDALEAAFTFDTEAIFFLSDGAPSAGKIVDPRGIVDYVSKLNQGRYVSVNTISIMGGAAFLEDLAKANHGSFRAVDK